ncbi:hypothetical protein GC176_23180 [bacterium]|nr:hypothetical protein [bacterium]
MIPALGPGESELQTSEIDDLTTQQEPTRIVEAYFELLRQMRGPDAIHYYWDNWTFAERLYGSDFTTLSEGDKRSVAKEHKRLTMGLYANEKVAKVRAVP